jgi:hypothetical protein
LKSTIFYVVAGCLVLTLLGVSLFSSASGLETYYTDRNPYDAKLDPRVGQDISLPEKDAFGRSIGLNGSTLLIYGGPCSECTLKSVNFSALPTDRHETVVVLFEGENVDIPKKFKGKFPKVRFVASFDPKFISSLNPAWIGRWYLLKSGRLVDIQQDINQTPIPTSVAS